MASPVVYAGFLGNRVRLWIICESCRRQIFLGSMITNVPTFSPPPCPWCHPAVALAADEDDISHTG